MLFGCDGDLAAAMSKALLANPGQLIELQYGCLGWWAWPCAIKIVLTRRRITSLRLEGSSRRRLAVEFPVETDQLGRLS